MSWAEEGEALDRMYAVHVAKANPERFERYLQRTYHKLVKEALGRLLPIQAGGRLFSIGELRSLLDLDDEEQKHG